MERKQPWKAWSSSHPEYGHVVVRADTHEEAIKEAEFAFGEGEAIDVKVVSEEEAAPVVWQYRMNQDAPEQVRIRYEHGPSDTSTITMEVATEEDAEGKPVWRLVPVRGEDPRVTTALCHMSSWIAERAAERNCWESRADAASP
jgi:hypothetical protein